jgi:hypothetical protein
MRQFTPHELAKAMAMNTGHKEVIEKNFLPSEALLEIYKEGLQALASSPPSPDSKDENPA